LKEERQQEQGQEQEQGQQQGQQQEQGKGFSSERTAQPALGVDSAVELPFIDDCLT
jgi:transcription initiation factor TFIID subunit TAF12